MANQIQGLRPDGTLPTVAVEHVQQIVEDTTVGIDEVSGAVTLESSGPRLREFYTVGTTVIHGEEFATDTALAVRRIASGAFEVAVVGEPGGWRAFGEVPVGPGGPDTIPPTAGTLAVTVTEDTITGAVAGAMDETALHSAPYRFSLDGTWSEWQASTEFVWEGLTPTTEYQVRHEVRDASGNTRVGAVVEASTTAVPVWVTLVDETFEGIPDGDFPAGRTAPGSAGLEWQKMWADGYGMPVVGEKVVFTPATETSTGDIRVNLPAPTMNDMRMTVNYESPTDSRRHGGTLVMAFGVQGDFAVVRAASAANAGSALRVEGVDLPESGELTLHWSPENRRRRVLLDGEEIFTETLVSGVQNVRGARLTLRLGAFIVDRIRIEEATT